MDHPYAHQAATDRHRLLRDVQPRQRDPRRCARDADRADHADGIGTRDGAEYDLDIIVFATGFDAMTGPCSRSTSAAGRAHAAPGVGGRTAHLSRPAGAGLPEHVHRHRPGQPVRAVQHAGGDRAACRVDHRCIADMRKHGLERIEPTPEAVDEWVAHVNDAANATLLPQARAFVVPRRQRARQAAGVHALCRRHGALPRDLRRGRRQRVRGFRPERLSVLVPAATRSGEEIFPLSR